MGAHLPLEGCLRDFCANDRHGAAIILDHKRADRTIAGF
jgi:hypothetical protein